MNILAIDTSSGPLSVALQAGDRVFACHRVFARPHDETLVPQVRRLLKRAGLKLADLNALAAASGPGRFTGIRVGMAYAAVLAGQLKVPALAVSRLEALARKIPADLVCAVLPGYKDEKFFQVFRSGRAAAPAAWVTAAAWPEARADLERRGAVLAEAEVSARDLLHPAALMMGRRRPPPFAPLYLKPASYERA